MILEFSDPGKAYMGSGHKMGKARTGRAQKKRLTIGLLIGRLGDLRYQAYVWPGIAEVAEERDANLICFEGRELLSPNGFDSQRNAVYNLVNPENMGGLDGLVALSSTLGHYIGSEQLLQFYQRYRPIPIVSIALLVNGIPSVLVDNRAGIRKAVTHLIEVHNCRRIAFIRGPEGHPEAEERYQAYTEGLAKHGFPLDPNLVAPGDFVFSSGVEAIRLMLDKRKVRFDAVVAANDEMALGALDSLEGRGIRVPDDVSVTGFDDIEYASFSPPPLTTVRQPLHEQGRRAAETLFELLAGRDVPDRITLPTELVVRQSCRCPSQTVLQAETTPVPWIGATLNFALAAQRSRILLDMAQTAVPKGVEPQWAEKLLDSFAADLLGKSPGTFLPALGILLRQVAAKNGNVASFQSVVSALRRHILPYLKAGEGLSRAENLWQQARVIIGETAQWSQARQRLQMERLAVLVSGISESLMTTFDLVGLPDAAARELPQMGIKSCYLSLFEQPVEKSQETPSEWSRLILAYNEDGRIALEPGGRRFPSLQLVPDGILSRRRRFAMVVEPLRFRDEAQLGFILFEPLQQEGGTLREMLSRQISTALRGALLMKARQQEEETLKEYSERLEAMVKERTRELLEAQEQLVRREKLAILGQLAGGVGHELRNPLGVISNASYFLKQTLPDSDKTTKEYLGILSSEVRNAEKIISDLLDLSRIRPAAREEIAVLELVAQASEKQPPPKNVKVNTMIGSDLPPAFVDPRQIVQVLINLMTNAFQAMPEGGTLTISAQVQKDKVAISVADTGCGIPQENLEKIFDPLFTTRARGIGLGLAISKNLMEVNGGSIEVKSKAGKGSTFIVSLPSSQGASTS
jgi:DNA-binding LacI/PurR family transcriptional regulator/signal transduction histidine kinase